jgi:hypothetical protein
MSYSTAEIEQNPVGTGLLTMQTSIIVDQIQKTGFRGNIDPQNHRSARQAKEILSDNHLDPGSESS